MSSSGHRDRLYFMQCKQHHLRQMLLRDLAHFDSSTPPGGVLGLGWVPSTLPSVPLPSESLQALPARAENGSRSVMVGFESLGSEGAEAAG